MPSRSSARSPLPVVVTLILGLAGTAFAATVDVGLGSYSTTLPPGEVGPRNWAGANVAPKVAPGFSLPAQTNDFWSSLIYPFYGDPHTNVLYAHPLMVKAVAGGLRIGHTPSHVYAANDYLFPWSQQLTVGVDGLASPQTTTRELSLIGRCWLRAASR